MISAPQQICVIAAKEISDACRTWLLLVLAALMLVASFVALTVAAFALQAEVATYQSARDMLLALGKPLSAIAPPAFYPLKLLRGFVEYIEILGAILGILLGYRAAAGERSHGTLALILTRPLKQATWLAGKIAGNLVLIAVLLTLTFLCAAIGIMLIAGVGLSVEEAIKLALTDLAGIVYVTLFFALGFCLTLTMRHLPHALLTAFTLWLVLVLIAPQIGDTLDPDNQVAGGVFRTLGIAKPQEIEILQSFKTYETIRDGIEQLSPAKHFERWSFALTGIKDIYNSQPVLAIMADRLADMVWLVALLATLLLALFTRRLEFSRLTKE